MHFLIFAQRNCLTHKKFKHSFKGLETGLAVIVQKYLSRYQNLSIFSQQHRDTLSEMKSMKVFCYFYMCLNKEGDTLRPHYLMLLFSLILYFKVKIISLTPMFLFTTIFSFGVIL